MIPTYKNSLTESFEINDTPKKVYKIDWENNRLLTRKIDGDKAVRQNIVVMTTVEYLEHEAMPNWFGIAMKDMYGIPLSFVAANLERLIKEAISTYNIVDRAYDFDIEIIDKYSLGVSFNAKLTDDSVLKMYLEVPVDV